MKRLVLVLILAAGSLGNPVTAVQSRPDFSGAWTGPAGSLTIQQNEGTLTVSEGADVRTLNLDGSAGRFAKGDTQYTARTRWVGSALVVSITTASPVGTWEDLEVYSLDYGPTLTVVYVGTQTRRPMMFTQTRTYEQR
jgi:hypothetical protein